MFYLKASELVKVVIGLALIIVGMGLESDTAAVLVGMPGLFLLSIAILKFSEPGAGD
jgi:hypothetical protein